MKLHLSSLMFEQELNILNGAHTLAQLSLKRNAYRMVKYALIPRLINSRRVCIQQIVFDKWQEFAFRENLSIALRFKSYVDAE